MALHRNSICETVSDGVSKENVAPANVAPEYVPVSRTTRSKTRTTAVLQEEQVECAPTVFDSASTLAISDDCGHGKEQHLSDKRSKGKAKATKKTVSSTSKKARGMRLRAGSKGQQKESCPFRDDGCEGKFVSTNHDVRRHMEIHTYAWQKAIYCARYHPFCAYTAVQDSNFRTHIRNHHKGKDGKTIICRAILQNPGPDGKPWVCNHACSGAPQSHWRNVHGTSTPETFNGTWFNAYFCSMDEFYQYHGYAPPLNCREGFEPRAQPIHYPKDQIDKLVDAYGGRGGWTTAQFDDWVRRETGFCGQVYKRDGSDDVFQTEGEGLGDDEVDELDESQTFYMPADAEDSDDETIDEDFHPQKEVLDDDLIPRIETLDDELIPEYEKDRDFTYGTWPPAPPPAGYTGSWDMYPKTCVYHPEFRRLWLIEGHSPEESYEIRREAYHLLHDPLVGPASQTLDAAAFDLPSWDVQPQLADASATYNEFAWALLPQPPSPTFAPEGYHAPPSTPYSEAYYRAEVPDPAAVFAYCQATYPAPAGDVSAFEQLQYHQPPSPQLQWQSAQSTAVPTRQTTPAPTADEQIAAEALLGLSAGFR